MTDAVYQDAQPSLFGDAPQTVPSVRWCIYDPPCAGVTGTLGPERPSAGCVNQSVTCGTCGRVVLDLSTRTCAILRKARATVIPALEKDVS